MRSKSLKQEGGLVVIENSCNIKKINKYGTRSPQRGWRASLVPRAPSRSFSIKAALINFASLFRQFHHPCGILKIK
jgi:hypothetical protein